MMSTIRVSSKDILKRKQYGRIPGIPKSAKPRGPDYWRAQAMAKRIRATFADHGKVPWFMKDERKDSKKMENFKDGTAHDSYKFIEELDLNEKETKNAMKEIVLRFDAKNYQKLESFDKLDLMQQLKIMYAITASVVKQVKNESDVKK